MRKKLLDAVKTSLIDIKQESQSRLRPNLLYNDYENGTVVLTELEEQLKECQEFWFSVAFITQSGIIMLKSLLKELERKNIRGRILTTNYLMFNSPKALKELLQFKNLEVRMFMEEAFHIKGYFFYHDNIRVFIVGSSNLTQGALKKNKEWNMKMTSMLEGEIVQQVETEFDIMWKRAIQLTEEWIDTEYMPFYQEKKKIDRLDKEQFYFNKEIKPNKMQKEALEALNRLRKKNARRALLISATGTGKTYLSAFDIKSYKPKKMLFLVHREQILKQAKQSFERVLGNQITMGLLTGNCQEKDADYIFATIQTMSKKTILELFKREHFEYIIIDETHKAGAQSYQTIIDYFQPKFLLGMTASPERMDGFDIFSLFDHNIAYEIRLQQAMEEDLLCPFHYFGVSELNIDGKEVEDHTEFRYLTSDERVNHIIENIKFYGYSGDRVRGLMFCGCIEEARELSSKFNKRGYQTVALSGNDSQEVREESIQKLEQEKRDDGLDYIFTVDIFNEGIDIPCVNQVIMLRPTKSSIIFVQQLGRGLRKYKEKEYVVVIDFIGNYKNNFLIPIALSGDRSYNKDTIRKYITEGSKVVPGCSTIHFDEIAKERIYHSINNTNFSNFRLLKESYINLKYKLGKIPSLMDFYRNGSIDVSLIFDSCKCYYLFLRRVEKEYIIELSEEQIKVLEHISMLLANGKRPHELYILYELMIRDKMTIEDWKAELEEKYSIQVQEQSLLSAIRILKGGFVNGNDKKKYGDCQYIDIVWRNNQKKEQMQVRQKENSMGMIQRGTFYERLIQHSEFKYYLQDVLEYGLQVYKNNYCVPNQSEGLKLYEKYSRKDVCRILNWENDESSTVYGYKIKHNTCIIFVTYHKSEGISESTKYEDVFLDEKTFSWMTRSNVHMMSKEPEAIFNYKETGMSIHLFVKKSDGEGRDFYYLGQVEPLREYSKETTQRNDQGKLLPIVNIVFALKKPVKLDLYNYLIH